MLVAISGGECKRVHALTARLVDREDDRPAFNDGPILAAFDTCGGAKGDQVRGVHIGRRKQKGNTPSSAVRGGRTNSYSFLLQQSEQKARAEEPTKRDYPIADRRQFLWY